MKLALDHLNQLKEIRNYPLWRTQHLEAQIYRWLATDATLNLDSSEKEGHRKALSDLLFDPWRGAIARAKRGEGMAMLSEYDMEGLLELHLMALRVEIDRGSPTEKIVHLLDDILTQVKTQGADVNRTPYFNKIVRTAALALSRVQPLMIKSEIKAWQERVDVATVLGQQAVNRKIINPDASVALAVLFAREAHMAASRGNTSHSLEMRTQSMQWVEDGLTVGTVNGLKSPQLSELHILAAEMKLLEKTKPEEVEIHLAALRANESPRVVAALAFLEGVLFERSGRLERARQKLEDAVQADTNRDLGIRPHLALSSIYLALHRPSQALASLRISQRQFNNMENRMPQEQAWAREFLRGTDEMNYLMFIATLDLLREKIAKHVSLNPGTTIPRDVVQVTEDSLPVLLEKIPRPSKRDREARLALVSYHARTDRLAKAREDLKDIAREYPASADVLRANVALALLQAGKSPANQPDTKTIDLADSLILEFLREHPTDKAAKIFWAEWLVGTSRPDKAITYIRGSPDLNDSKNERFDRVLSGALLQTGQREEGLKLLSHLRHDPTVDAMLIQAISSKEEREKEVSEALVRHENNALFRIWDAELKFSRQLYAEAARGYSKATEFTRVRLLAQSGLRRALFALADQDPAGAKKLSKQLLDDVPDEATPLLGFAYACLLLNDIGKPGDDWKLDQTMASALAEWNLREHLEPQVGQEHIRVYLTRAEYWTLANNPLQALQEVEQALKLNSNHAGALSLSISIILNSDYPSLFERASKQLNTLRKVKVDSPDVLFLTGRMQEVLNQPSEAIKSYESLLENHPTYRLAYSRLLPLLKPENTVSRLDPWVLKWRKDAPEDQGAVETEIATLASSGRVNKAKQVADKFTVEVMQQTKERLAKLSLPPGSTLEEWEREMQLRLGKQQSEIDLTLARGFVRGESTQEAEVRLTSILQKQPNLPAALLLMGDISIWKQDWITARDIYTKLLTKVPKHSLASNNLAWILANKLDNPQEAYEVLSEMRKIRNSTSRIPGERLSLEILDTFGSVYRKLNQPELTEEMRELFDSACRRYPNDSRLFLYLGEAYAKLKQSTRAKKMYTTAIELCDPKVASSLTSEQRRKVIEAATNATRNINY